MSLSLAKNLVILAVEIITIFLMVLGILPLEMSLALTGLLIFYFIFSPLKDSLWIFIASLPLFVALPLTASFDSMANWRLLLTVLFLVWFFKKFSSGGLSAVFDWIKKELQNKTVALTIIFLAVGLISLLVAQDKIIGFKKILYFINIGLVFFVVREVAAKKENLKQIFQAVGVALGITLTIGYGQLVSTMIVPLHVFWKSWAGHVIPVFYGQPLAHLLEYSNTWFSYYVGAPPTLRMFSVFPDSHSFALFFMIGLIYLLSLIFLRPKQNKKLLVVYYLSLALILMALVFTGSRGIWVSALVPLVGLIFITLPGHWLARGKNKFRHRVRDKIRKWLASIGQAKVSQLVLGSLILFFALFPLASSVQFIAQENQWGTVFERARSITDFSETSVKNRLQIWGKTIESISRYPWLGVGIGNFPRVLEEEMTTAKKGSSAHNLYLDVASEMGFFAMFILLAIFWQIFKTSWQVWQKNQGLVKVFALIFLLYLVWILCYSLFDVVLFNDKVLLFFVISLAVLYAAAKTSGFYKSSRL